MKIFKGVCCLWVLWFPFTLVAQVAVPYSTGFEDSEGFVENAPLSGVWSATDYSVSVSADDAHSGSLSVKIPAANPENVVGLSFDPGALSVLYVDYFTRVSVSDPPLLPLLTLPTTSAVVGLQPSGSSFGEWVFLDGDGSGSGCWRAGGPLVPVDVTGLSGWHRVTLRMDLNASVWDAYIDGQPVAMDMGFAEAFTLGDESVLIYANQLGVSYLDDFQLTSTNPVFIDQDADGIGDEYELLYGLNPNLDDRYLDADSDGVRNVDEFLLGSDPLEPSDSLLDIDGDGYSGSVELVLGSNPAVFSGSISGAVVLNHWSGISGTSVSGNLKADPDYPFNPDRQEIITSLRFPSDVGDNYGNEARGFIIPPETGGYIFWVASNNNGALYLSDGESSADPVAVAYVIGDTAVDQWTKYSSQKSNTIQLVAGQKYYFEAAHKEATHSDHFSVAWTKPDGTFEIVPASALASIPPNDLDLDGFPDSVERLIIDADTGDAIKTLEQVLVGDDFDLDGLTNLEEWKAGTNPTLEDTDGDLLPDGFEHSRDAYDPIDDSDAESDYDMDGYIAAIEILIGSDPDVFDTTVPEFVVVEEWNSVSGVLISDLLSAPNYPSAPDELFVLSQLELPSNRKESFGSRIQGYIIPDVTGNYTFWIASDDSGQLWLGTDQYPESATLVCEVSGHTDYRQWAKYSSQQSVSIPLEAGKPYYFDARMKEATGGDHMSIAWTKPDASFEIIPAQNLSTFAVNDHDWDGAPDHLEWQIIHASSTDLLLHLEDVDSAADFDGDGIVNSVEWNLGYSAVNPDEDSDGMLDGFEQSIVEFDSQDGINDIWDVLPEADFDGDGLTNLQEFWIQSDPTLRDTNGDGRDDLFEWMVIHADLSDDLVFFSDVQSGLALRDVDGDGLTDIHEFDNGLRLDLKDTDGDGLSDGWEVTSGYSALSNEGISGAFGDLEGDLLANAMESLIGSSSSIADDSASIQTTATDTAGEVAIVLIGRGAFTVSETSGASSLSD